MRSMNSSYRFQFTPSFGFGEAAEIVPYLAELGIDAIYASPVFRAAKGSLHGYDIIDQNEISPELGGAEEFEALSGVAREHGLGWIQDIVPNHMAFNSENRLLMDVLESGENSAFHSFFDIDWDSPHEGLRGRLLAPFLGEFYGKSLEEGEIRLRYDRGGFTANYYDHSFPLKIESYADIIGFNLNRLRVKLGGNHPDFLKLLGTLYVLQNLPPGDTPAERKDQVLFVKQMLWELYSSVEEYKTFLDENLTVFNGSKGNTKSFNSLDRLLADQHFRFAFWKVATQEINYKRFFTVNNLIALRSELDRVFSYTHALILRSVREGIFSGLRVDHVDGLFEPGNYLRKLRERSGDIPIYVEKILGLDERLPQFWPIQGTTGYDFLNHVNGLFCDTGKERSFDRIYTRVIGVEKSFQRMEYEKKKLIIENHMAGDVDNLANRMKRVSGSYRHGYDITLFHLKQAIIEVMARYPVYRTYVGEKKAERSQDSEYILQAVKAASGSNPDLAYEIDFIKSFLLQYFGAAVSGEGQDLWLDVVSRLEQFAVPLKAKGFEDTVLYTWNRLISLNEVGGNPGRFCITPETFHNFNIDRFRFWPEAMNATATHDMKRGEDVRARINALSEIPGEWERRIRAWKKLNGNARKRIGGKIIPDDNEEYFLYQTLVGAFPFESSERKSFTERMREYIRKSLREAKVHTAWLQPDDAYEEACITFLNELLDPDTGRSFMEDFIPFQRRIAWYGMLNSLSQTLLKITVPGFPDFYQGTELWDLSLVDPDNRRPVDYRKRRSFLRDIISRSRDIPALIPELFASKEDGRVKLFLIYRALKARNEQAALFRFGEYLPLKSTGIYRNRLLAFVRKREKEWAAVVTPRLLTGLVKEGALPLGKDIWSNTQVRLPKDAPEAWVNAVTGERLNSSKTIPIGDALKRFPVALLISAR